MPIVNEENEFVDCAGYETCRKFRGEEILDCEDCGNYIPTDCFEDFGGREPFFYKVSKSSKKSREKIACKDFDKFGSSFEDKRCRACPRYLACFQDYVRKFVEGKVKQCSWRCPRCKTRCGGIKGHRGEHQCPRCYKGE